jgi:hypothetical protein
VDREQYIEQINARLRQRIYDLELAIETGLGIIQDLKDDDISALARTSVYKLEGGLSYALHAKLSEEVMDWRRKANDHE